MAWLGRLTIGDYLILLIEPGTGVAALGVLAGTNNISIPAIVASGTYLVRFTGSDGSSTVVRLVYER